MEEQLLQLSHQKVQLSEKLRKWIGISVNDSLNLTLQYPEKEPSAITTVNQEVVSYSLMVQKAQAMKDKADQMVLVEKDRYLPDFTAQVEFWDNAGMDNQYGAQLAMSIPWFNGKNDASIKEAEAMSRSRDQLRKNSINAISQLLTTMLSDLKTTQAKIKLYETDILKNAELSLSSFQKAFEVDKASFLDYFESKKTLYTLEMQHAKLVNKRHVLHTQINAFFAKGAKK
ncbi:MAG: TolC family protein [Desulfobacteraceae bacterium]|nr:TolC family protein [Desulfobacteraceae bacterium]